MSGDFVRGISFECGQVKALASFISGNVSSQNSVEILYGVLPMFLSPVEGTFRLAKGSLSYGNCVEIDENQYRSLASKLKNGSNVI